MQRFQNCLTFGPIQLSHLLVLKNFLVRLLPPVKAFMHDCDEFGKREGDLLSHLPFTIKMARLIITHIIPRVTLPPPPLFMDLGW